MAHVILPFVSSTKYAHWLIQQACEKLGLRSSRFFHFEVHERPPIDDLDLFDELHTRDKTSVNDVDVYVNIIKLFCRRLCTAKLRRIPSHAWIERDRAKPLDDDELMYFQFHCQVAISQLLYYIRVTGHNREQVMQMKHDVFLWTPPNEEGVPTEYHFVRDLPWVAGLYLAIFQGFKGGLAGIPGPLLSHAHFMFGQLDCLPTLYFQGFHHCFTFQCYNDTLEYFFTGHDPHPDNPVIVSAYSIHELLTSVGCFHWLYNATVHTREQQRPVTHTNTWEVDGQELRIEDLLRQRLDATWKTVNMDEKFGNQCYLGGEPESPLVMLAVFVGNWSRKTGMPSMTGACVAVSHNPRTSIINNETESAGSRLTSAAHRIVGLQRQMFPHQIESVELFHTTVVALERVVAARLTLKLLFWIWLFRTWAAASGDPRTVFALLQRGINVLQINPRLNVSQLGRKGGANHIVTPLVVMKTLAKLALAVDTTPLERYNVHLAAPLRVHFTEVAHALLVFTNDAKDCLAETLQNMAQVRRGDVTNSHDDNFRYPAYALSLARLFALRSDVVVNPDGKTKKRVPAPVAHDEWVVQVAKALRRDPFLPTLQPSVLTAFFSGGVLDRARHNRSILASRLMKGWRSAATRSQTVPVVDPSFVNINRDGSFVEDDPDQPVDASDEEDAYFNDAKGTWFGGPVNQELRKDSEWHFVWQYCTAAAAVRYMTVYVKSHWRMWRLLIGDDKTVPSEEKLTHVLAITRITQEQTDVWQLTGLSGQTPEIEIFRTLHEHLDRPDNSLVNDVAQAFTYRRRDAGNARLPRISVVPESGIPLSLQPASFSEWTLFTCARLLLSMEYTRLALRLSLAQIVDHPDQRDRNVETRDKATKRLLLGVCLTVSQLMFTCMWRNRSNLLFRPEDGVSKPQQILDDLAARLQAEEKDKKDSWMRPETITQILALQCTTTWDRWPVIVTRLVSSPVACLAHNTQKRYDETKSKKARDPRNEALNIDLTPFEHQTAVVYNPYLKILARHKHGEQAIEYSAVQCALAFGSKFLYMARKCANATDSQDNIPGQLFVFLALHYILSRSEFPKRERLDEKTDLMLDKPTRHLAVLGWLFKPCVITNPQQFTAHSFLVGRPGSQKRPMKVSFQDMCIKEQINALMLRHQGKAETALVLYPLRTSTSPLACECTSIDSMFVQFLCGGVSELCVDPHREFKQHVPYLKTLFPDQVVHCVYRVRQAGAGAAPVAGRLDALIESVFGKDMCDGARLRTAWFVRTNACIAVLFEAPHERDVPTSTRVLQCIEFVLTRTTSLIGENDTLRVTDAASLMSWSDFGGNTMGALLLLQNFCTNNIARVDSVDQKLARDDPLHFKLETDNNEIRLVCDGRYNSKNMLAVAGPRMHRLQSLDAFTWFGRKDVKMSQVTVSMQPHGENGTEFQLYRDAEKLTATRICMLALPRFPYAK